MFFEDGNLILDLSGVRRKGREEGHAAVPVEALAPETRAVVKRLRVDCAVSHVGGETFYLDGTLSGEIASPCARCLAETARDAEFRFAALLCPEGTKKDEEAPFRDENADVAFYDEREQFALLPFLEAEIALGSPMRMLCRENCAGLCAHCGANLNEGACACREEAALDPRLAPLLALRGRLGRRAS